MQSLILFLLFLNALLGVRAFSFTTSTPTQCGTFTVNWTGTRFLCNMQCHHLPCIFSWRRSTTICAGNPPCKWSINISIIPPGFTCFQVLGTQRVFNIPSSALSKGVGSYSTSLPFPQNHQFVVTMSDAIGFATGGISPLLTVQAPASQSTECNTTDPGPQFVYSLDATLQQCQ